MKDCNNNVVHVNLSLPFTNSIDNYIGYIFLYSPYPISILLFFTGSTGKQEISAPTALQIHTYIGT